CRSSLLSLIVSFILMSLACPVFVVELPQNLVPVLRHRLSYNGVQLLSQLVMQETKDGLRSSHHVLVRSRSCRQKLSRTLGCSQSCKAACPAEPHRFGPSPGLHQSWRREVGIAIGFAALRSTQSISSEVLAVRQ